MRQRFIDEARAAASLRHPNVASVFHLGKIGEDYFYAMEFVEGEPSKPDAQVPRAVKGRNGFGYRGAGGRCSECSLPSKPGPPRYQA